jgi:hypothetical protein
LAGRRGAVFVSPVVNRLICRASALKMKVQHAPARLNNEYEQKSCPSHYDVQLTAEKRK